MATLTVRIDNELHDEVEQSADFNGLSIADYIRETLSERVQDEQDYKEVVKTIQTTTETVSREEVIKQVFG
ncbi:DUF6290 family protein [Weissella hellenica]|uniref:DUF6290 family protein n=1 Tax=Weissella hellenica TaxID=46256 RepID=UPI00388956D2